MKKKMKRLQVILCGSGLALMIGALLNAADAAEPDAVSVPAGEPAASAPDAATTPIVVTGEVAEIRSDRMLARVNGAAITLNDLTPTDSSVITKQSMSREMYDYLLKQAIESELTFQTAKARGMELTEAQKQTLEKIRIDALERAGAPYVGAHYNAPAQAAIEVRNNQAMMLQNAMLNESGSIDQVITPERVQAYYQEHETEFGSLPKNTAAREKAWPKIEAEIRTRLIPDVNAEHEQKRRQLLEDLKAGADIQQFFIMVKR